MCEGCEGSKQVPFGLCTMLLLSGIGMNLFVLQLLYVCICVNPTQYSQPAVADVHWLKNSSNILE